MGSSLPRVMRPLLAVCAGVLLAHGAAWAAATAPAAAAATPAVSASGPASAPASPSSPKSVTASAQGGQRSKMKTCNDEARQKDLHKAERRAFMKQCLSKGSAA